jgi:hypothetical protein
MTPCACPALYVDDVFTQLIFHPGGLNLTRIFCELPGAGKIL